MKEQREKRERKTNKQIYIYIFLYIFNRKKNGKGSFIYDVSKKSNIWSPSRYL